MSDTMPPSREDGDRIPDTPLYDRKRAVHGYALNKMAMSLCDPESREAFLADEAA